MDLEKRISQALEPLSSFTKEKWSNTEYEIRNIINVNDITVFLSFGENETVLDYHYVSPISYGSLTEENRQLVDNCLSIINSLSPRGNWYFEELEKEHPDEDLEFLMYKATWPAACPPEQVGSEIFNTLIILGELHGFIGMFMFSAEDVPETNNKEEKKPEKTED